MAEEAKAPAAQNTTTTTTTTVVVETHPGNPGGCNCNLFCAAPFGFGEFMRQITSCVVGKHISVEEKTGLMWWSKPHKGCGNLDNAHSAFIAWLTMMVWVQIIQSILYFLTIAIFVDVPGGASQYLGSLIFQIAWCLFWTYIGWWALESRNRNWSIVYLVIHGLWALSVVLNVFDMLDLMSYDGIFIISLVAIFVLAVAVVHTLVFGCSTFMKLNPELHKPSAPADP